MSTEQESAVEQTPARPGETRRIEDLLNGDDVNAAAAARAGRLLWGNA